MYETWLFGTYRFNNSISSNYSNFNDVIGSILSVLCIRLLFETLEEAWDKESFYIEFWRSDKKKFPPCVHRQFPLFLTLHPAKMLLVFVFNDQLLDMIDHRWLRTLLYVSQKEYFMNNPVQCLWKILWNILLLSRKQCGYVAIPAVR